jgi:hypothetical protein
MAEKLSQRTATADKTGGYCHIILPDGHGAWLSYKIAVTDLLAGAAGLVTWDDVHDKPTFATVATSGSYDDLLDKPSWSDISYEVKFEKTVEQPAYSNSFSGSKTIDFSLGNIQYMPITGTISITLSSLREGVNMLILTNDSTPGRAVTIDSTFGTKTDNSASHSTGANKVNIYTIMKYGSTIKYSIETSS